MGIPSYNKQSFITTDLFIDETIYQGGGEVATALLVLAELGSSTGYSLIF